MPGDRPALCPQRDAAHLVDLPGVTITDDADQFWNAVGDLLSGDSAGPARPPDAMAGLLWEESLNPMVRASEALVANR